MMHLPTLVTKNRNIMSPSIGWLSLVLTVSSVVASRGSHASTHTERGSQWPMKGKRLRGNRAYQIMLPAEQSHHYDAELRVSSIGMYKSNGEPVLRLLDVFTLGHQRRSFLTLFSPKFLLAITIQKHKSDF